MPRRRGSSPPAPGDTVASAVGRRKVFSPDSRLRRHADFQFVRERGREAVGRYCVIRVVEPPDGCRRVGFVISRHYSKRAVDRNRVRRLFREAYRQVYPALRPLWLELRPRAYMKGIKLGDFQPELQRLLSQVGGFAPGAPGAVE